MTALAWDASGQHFYETGVDHGVLYLPTDGVYDTGVAWNGLTGVTETPSGAESTKLYADNIVYVNLLSLEQFGGTITAYTYPDLWAECDGTKIQDGVQVGQQNRRTFGMSYRTRIGNDELADAYGYKLHLIWGALASPSERAYPTINDSPSAIEFSWAINTTPLPVIGHEDDFKPTAFMAIPSNKVDADALTALEELLYGTVSADAQLPLPGEVLDIFGGTALATDVDVAGDTASVDITGTTTNYLFKVEEYDGSAFTVVTGGNMVNEAAAEALTLSTGIHRVTLYAASGFYVPGPQQSVFIVNVT